jgi:rhodanese-related sulfurtransferase
MKIQTISCDNLRQKLQQQENILIVDVRQHFERENGIIENDINISLNELNCDKLPRLDLPIIFYCRSGVRSFMACQNILKENPNLDVYNLEGGMIAWNSFIN